jgi:methylenetetrahydrofolate dehydrogenase (NADP+)/methenyltetrahydrofolate cyclohydrolase
MKATILDTRELAARGRRALACAVEAYGERTGTALTLAMVSVGDGESIRDYVRVVSARAREVGISVVAHDWPGSMTREQLGEQLSALNADPSVHGISLQLPLAPHLNPEEVATALDPDKDVEGFHPANVRDIALGTPRLVPPPAQGALEIMQAFGIEPRGKQAVVVGRSAMIGRAGDASDACRSQRRVAHAAREPAQAGELRRPARRRRLAARCLTVA